MKNTKSFPAKKEKIETDCTCCQELGTAEVVDWLIKQDVKADMKKAKRANKQVEVFVDKDHPVADIFYELVEKNIPDDEKVAEMRKIIAKDPYFLDPYLFIAFTLLEQDKIKEGIVFLEKAFHKALAIITNEQGEWPQEMPWGFTENRHILRAINDYAEFCWMSERTEDALEIFRKLLRVNPNDNLGVRYSILAINMKLEFDWQEQFLVKEDGGFDTVKVTKWFDKNAPKFEEDFKWLLDYYKAQNAGGDVAL